MTRLLFPDAGRAIRAVLVSLLVLIGPLVSGQTRSPPTDADGLAASEYLLGAGDVIGVSVYGESDLSLEVMIDDTGQIMFPLLGDVRVVGIPTQQVAQLIRKRLVEGEILVSPEVTVTIVEYRPIYINGEVRNPGKYPFQPGLTLLKAITIAGGFTERASQSRITVLSATGDSVRSVDSLDILIEPDDIITVNQRLF